MKVNLCDECNELIKGNLLGNFGYKLRYIKEKSYDYEYCSQKCLFDFIDSLDLKTIRSFSFDNYPDKNCEIEAKLNGE